MSPFSIVVAIIMDDVKAHCMAWASAGYPGILRPIGGGISLGGVQRALVEDCVAYGNGWMNNSTQGGPVG